MRRAVEIIRKSVDVVGGLVCLTWCPGRSSSCSHGDVAVGMGFKPLKAESEDGGDCLGGVVTHLGSLGHMLLVFVLSMASIRVHAMAGNHIRRSKKDPFMSEYE